MPVLEVIVPVGISFYTFEAINYTVDVYRGKCRAAHDLTHFMLFVLIFPHLVAGPIVRARGFLPLVARRKHWSWLRANTGVLLVLMGVVKKMAIADRIAMYVDPVFADPASFATATLWLALVAYAIQIYCDFSGYSDIALGLAHLLGYHLAQNFNMPLVAPSIAEFWKRWHISLSSWIRDYVFIPLGGSRGTRWQTYRNLVVTFTLCGMWHGAGWNFVLWGTLQGIAMVFAALWSRYLPSPPAPLGWAATITFFVVTLVFFRSPNLGYAFNYLDTMLSFRGGWPTVVDDAAPPWEVVAGVVGLFALHWIEFRLQQPGVLRVMRRAEGPVSRGFLSGVALLLILIPVTNVNPFIYFRF